MIYLDHAAATPVSKKALTAMMPFFAEEFFNPSAPYLPAKRAREAYEAAKDEIAHAIGAKGADLIMTAGATEATNLAMTVAAAEISGEGKAAVLVAATEHASVLAAAEAYGCEKIRVRKDGMVDLADLRAKITDETVLISVALANNELGTVQPLGEISEIVKKVRQERLARGVTTPLFLHSDASQALNLLDISVARLGVDLLTLNAAKCGGPKGVGALYMAHSVPVQPLTLGGGQERGLRSGTENVPGVVGFAVAMTEAKKHLAGNRKKYEAMRSALMKELVENLSGTHTAADRRHGDSALFLAPLRPERSPKDSCQFLLSKHQLTSFLPVCFPGIDAERLVYKLEQRGIYVSTGAACAANKGTKSHVLEAIGLSDAEIAGSLRISLGATNTPEQMTGAGRAIAAAVREEYERLGR